MIKNQNKKRNNIITLILILVFLGLAILIPSFNSMTVTSLFSKICIFIIAALSLNLLCGNLGELVLGQGGFILIGFLVSFLFSDLILNLMLNTMSAKEMREIIYMPTTSTLKPLGYLIIIGLTILSGVISGAIGFVIGLIVLGRLKGDYLAIVTLGINLIFVCLSENIIGADTYSITTKISGTPIIYATFLVITIVFLVFLIKSRFGRSILAIRDDAIASEASGIPVKKYKIMTFVISTFIAGMAGGLYCFFQPERASYFNQDLSIELLLMIVLGGLGSYTGTFIAVPLLIIFNQYVLILLPEQFSNNPKIFYGILLVVIMLFRTEGILGTKELSLNNLYNKVFKRKESRDNG